MRYRYQEYIDKNGETVSLSKLKKAIDFSESDYQKKKNKEFGIVPFSSFLHEIIKVVEWNDGTFQDAVFIANENFKSI